MKPFPNLNIQALLSAHFKWDWQVRPAIERMPRRKKHYLRRIVNTIYNLLLRRKK
jgi:hypothetical protein